MDVCVTAGPAAGATSGATAARGLAAGAACGAASGAAGDVPMEFSASVRQAQKTMSLATRRGKAAAVPTAESIRQLVTHKFGAEAIAEPVAPSAGEGQGAFL